MVEITQSLPEAVEMEKKLLSAMMLHRGDVIPMVATRLQAEDFYRVEHRMIYSAMIAVYNRGVPPDVLLIEEELKTRQELTRVKRGYLFSLIDLEFTTARAEGYVDTIKAKSILRRLVMAGREIATEALREGQSAGEVLEFAEQKILTVTSSTNRSGFDKIAGVLSKSFDRIQRVREHFGEVSGVPSGLESLDKVTNGLQRSDLILLAARPSMGKTALALNIAAGAARAKKVVAVFSLEMSKSQLGTRLLSMQSGVNSQSLNTGSFNDKDMDKLLDALDDLSELSLYIDDTAGISLLELRSKSRRLKHEAGLDLIVIDYLQLMQGGRQENRQQEISEISRSLKGLARELDVPILALSQLSRSVEMRADKKPQLSDLRESGSLEQDADIVMFLYRDEYYNRDEAESKNIAEVIIAKNRNGPTTSINLQFDKEVMRFGDLVRRGY